ncbi:MAG: hypothetical protein WBR29_09770 [Gammaproteobacteria bacterium]
MIIEKFNYKGFTIKVSAHELFHGLGPSGVNLGWYTSSVAISKNPNDKYCDHEESLHPGRISVSPDRAMDYGKKFARHVVDEEILYSNLSKFMTTRPI